MEEFVFEAALATQFQIHVAHKDRLIVCDAKLRFFLQTAKHTH